MCTTTLLGYILFSFKGCKIYNVDPKNDEFKRDFDPIDFNFDFYIFLHYALNILVSRRLIKIRRENYIFYNKKKQDFRSVEDLFIYEPEAYLWVGERL